MRNKILLIMSIFAIITTVIQAKYVKGYYKKNGTYVNGYNRSSSNKTVRDNYSHKGNYNSYTGANGSNYNRKKRSSEYYGTSNKNSYRY